MQEYNKEACVGQCDCIGLGYGSCFSMLEPKEIQLLQKGTILSWSIDKEINVTRPLVESFIQEAIRYVDCFTIVDII